MSEKQSAKPQEKRRSAKRPDSPSALHRGVKSRSADLDRTADQEGILDGRRAVTSIPDQDRPNTPAEAPGSRVSRFAHDLSQVPAVATQQVHAAPQNVSQIRGPIVQRELTDEQALERAQRVREILRGEERAYSALDALLVAPEAEDVHHLYRQYIATYGRWSFSYDLRRFVSGIPAREGQSPEEVQSEQDAMFDRYAARLYDAGVREIQVEVREDRPVPVTPENERRLVERWRHYFFGGPWQGRDYAPLARWILDRWTRIQAVEEIQRRGWMPSKTTDNFRASFGMLSEHPRVHPEGMDASQDYWSSIHSRYQNDIAQTIEMANSYHEAYVAALGNLLTPLLIAFYGVEPAVASASETYLRVLLAVMPITFVGLTLMSAFTGVGGTFTPMIVSAVSNTLNIVGNYVLIFGHFGFPEMGIQGAAIASAGAFSVFTLLLLVLAFRKKSLVPLRVSDLWRSGTAQGCESGLDASRRPAIAARRGDHTVGLTDRFPPQARDRASGAETWRSPEFGLG